VDDLSVGSNVFGMFVAALAVVSSGMQQIYVGTMQAKHKLNANELLSNTAPAQARSPAGLQKPGSPKTVLLLACNMVQCR